MPAHTTTELALDIQRAWELLEDDTGDTSDELVELYSHFDWVLREWPLQKAQRETIQPLNTLIGKELRGRGYDGREIKYGLLAVKGSLAKKLAIAETSRRPTPKNR